MKQFITIQTRGEFFQGEVVLKKNGRAVSRERFNNDFLPQLRCQKKKKDVVEVQFNGVKSEDFNVVVRIEPQMKRYLWFNSLRKSAML